jgi:hypothetical protein
MDGFGPLDPHGVGPQEEEIRAEEPDVAFSPVRMEKFVLLNLLTFGLYQLVWLYRSWRYVKRVEGSKILPPARAFFSPLFYYALLRRLDVRAKGAWALAYVLFLIVAALPQPFFLGGVLSFLPLVPAVRAMNRMNGVAAVRFPSYRWRARSAVVGMVGLFLAPFWIAGAFGPPTWVVPGAEMREADLRYLSATGLLEEGEEVLFFYSGGFLSIEADGVFVSDLGITSYWLDPISENLMVAFLTFEEIVDLEVNYASHFLEDTAVRITGPGDVWFLFTLPPDDGGDRRFVEEVERRRMAVPESTITA